MLVDGSYFHCIFGGRDHSAPVHGEDLVILNSMFLLVSVEREFVYIKVYSSSVSCSSWLVLVSHRWIQGSLEIHFLYSIQFFFFLIIFCSYWSAHFWMLQMYLLVLILISCVLPISDGLVTCGLSFSSKGIYFVSHYIYLLAQLNSFHLSASGLTGCIDLYLRCYSIWDGS